ncbi:MAG: hypothetical protein IT536_07575 [Hyphomicrobiales bacterium]|nr:hypothetical protein [Hyphomicrobiales bacterium]
MRLSTMTLAAALAAGAAGFAGPSLAAPLSQSLMLKSADVGLVEQVQHRWHRHGHWVGPAAGFAAGLAIGGAVGAFGPYHDGYYAYGAAPGYVEPGLAFGAAPGWPVNRSPTRLSPQFSSCTGDRVNDSSYPSYYCAD